MRVDGVDSNHSFPIIASSLAKLQARMEVFSWIRGAVLDANIEGTTRAWLDRSRCRNRRSRNRRRGWWSWYWRGRLWWLPAHFTGQTIISKALRASEIADGRIISTGPAMDAVTFFGALTIASTTCAASCAARLALRNICTAKILWAVRLRWLNHWRWWGDPWQVGHICCLWRSQVNCWWLPASWQWLGLETSLTAQFIVSKASTPSQVAGRGAI